MIGLLILTIYILGFCISLLTLSKYGNKLGWDMYGPPHDDYYDDYDSNAHTYLWFSIIWPFFWVFNLIAFLYNGLLSFSNHIYYKFNKKQENERI